MDPCSNALGRIVLALGWVSLLAAPSVAQGSACQAEWVATFGHNPHLLLPPLCLTSWDDGGGTKLYAGTLGSVWRLDADDWTEIGHFDVQQGAFHVEVDVVRLFVHDDGNGAALFACGEFGRVNGARARGIARWDGQVWSEVGNLAVPHALPMEGFEVFDDGLGAGPQLYVCGSFVMDQVTPAIELVARWDGSSWSALGSGIAGTRILDLETFDDGGGPALYAAGLFDVAGTPTPDLARWDGTSWTLLGAGLAVEAGQAPVLHLEAFDDGLGPALYVTGSLTQVDGQPAGHAGRWDGTSWSTLSGGVTFTIRAAEVFDDGSGPALYAGGTPDLIRRWDGAAWSTAGALLSTGTVNDLAIADDGGGPTLFVCQQQGSVNAVSVTRWSGGDWEAPPWIDGEVRALTSFDDGLGAGPQLIAGGAFTFLDGVRAKHLARWDGAGWSPLVTLSGGGVVGIWALLPVDDGTGPVLYAGGSFNQVDGTVSRSVARWDGTSWGPVAPGCPVDVVRALAHDPTIGGGPTLYAAGQAVSTLARITRWEGAGWSPLGLGMNNTVHALEVHDDGLGGGPALYAAGEFTTAGGIAANRVARWDGSSWSPLGAGMNNRVSGLLSFDDGTGPALYATGLFTVAGAVSARRIARWDGLAWTTVGTGIDGTGQCLAAFDAGDGLGRRLYLGGALTLGGFQFPNGVTRWDGTTWTGLGSIGAGTTLGTTATLYCLYSHDDGSGAPSLFAGGSYTHAGEPGDSYLARWQGCASIPPRIACPDEVFAGTAGASGTVVTFEVTATGAGSPAPTVVCVPPSGSFFPVGTTQVDCTATDAMGNESACQFPVTVYRKARIR